MANTNSESKPAKITKKMDIYLAGIEKFMLIISIIALIIMFLSMLSGVISREIFNVSLLWTNELAGYAMVYLVFLSIPWVLREKSHVFVDLIVNKLPKKTLKINSIIVCIVLIGILTLLFISSFEITMNYFTRDIVMLGFVSWPKYLLVLPITIGLFFTVLRLVVETFKTIFLDKTIFPEDDVQGI